MAGNGSTRLDSSLGYDSPTTLVDCGQPCFLFDLLVVGEQTLTIQQTSMKAVLIM